MTTVITNTICEWIITNIKLRKTIHFDIINHNEIHIVNYYGSAKIIICNDDHLIFNAKKFYYHDPDMLHDFKQHFIKYVKMNFLYPFAK